MSYYYPSRYNLSATFWLDNEMEKDVYDMIHRQPVISEFLRCLLLDFYSVHGNVHYYCSIPQEERLKKFFITKDPEPIIQEKELQMAQDILEFMGSGLMTKDMDGASAMYAFMDFLAKKYHAKPAPTPSPAA